MTSALMEADDSPIISENNDFESQILSSQESLVRLNHELDNALLRIATLENICSENQIDLHEKRSRIKDLINEIDEREETNERLTQELNDKDEKLKNLNELMNQLKEHVKQYQFLFDDFGDISINDLRSQIQFDRQFRELILEDYDYSSDDSPEDVVEQYHQNQRLKFHNLLQESLITEDISQLIDSDDILFELLTRLNSLNRLKETISHDTKQLHHIRSVLHLPTDNYDELIDDLITKRQCIEYLRNKIDTNTHLTDMELIKHVLHDYFNFQQQQIDLKEYLQLNHENDGNYSRILIERCNEFNHINKELNERVQTYQQFKNQIISKFSDQDINDDWILDHLQPKTGVPETNEKHSEQDHIDELTREIEKLKEEANHRQEQLKEIINSDNNDEETQFNLIRSLMNFQLALREKFSNIDNNESILQRLDDYQLIINTLNSPENDWTDDTTDQLITKLQTFNNLQNQLDQSITNEQQLQNNIKQIADQFSLHTDDDEESDLTRIHHSLQTLNDFRQEILQTNDISESLDKTQEKQDVEIQTINQEDDFYLQIKELIGIEEDHPEAIINKLKELFETSNENYYRLEQEHEILVQSIQRLMNKLGLSSDSSPGTQIDEICNIFDTFSFEYCQSTSTNLMEIFKQIQIENTRLKTMIHQIDLNESTNTYDYISKLQIYITKVDSLCQLIAHENANIDQALIIYQTKIEQDDHTVEKIADFKQQLLTRLSIENEEQIFDRLDELEHIKTVLTEKLQHSDNILTSKLSEQQNKIHEYEDTVEKLRLQRERMLTKMKEIKTNNESLTTQLQTANHSIDEFHRKEIDYKNQIETIAQQLRSANDQIQVTLDDCQTQQDLQETMKLEIDSLKNEMETQRKLYENRCRQIINEKKQLDKNSKGFLEDKQILEEENKQLQTILQTIKDSLENVDDIHSIVDGILKLHDDLLILHQQNEQIQNENEKLLSNIVQQESTIREYIQIKNEFEKRLIDNDHQLINLKKQIEEHLEQYQKLQKQFQLYKEVHQTKTDQQVAMITVEQSPPPLQPHLSAVQQAAETNDWMTIDMKDEEIPLTTTHKHPTVDASTALFNLLGELKSKLGITLTHRPRSSSVFFMYLCAVHLLTIYLLFISHC